MTGLDAAVLLAASALSFGAGYLTARRPAGPQPIEITGGDMAAELTIRRGDTVAWAITIPEGQGIDTLAGITPRAEMRGASEQLTMTAFVISPTDRRISVTANAAQTLRMPFGVYRLVVELVATGGLVRSTFAIGVEVTDGIFDV